MSENIFRYDSLSRINKEITVYKFVANGIKRNVMISIYNTSLKAHHYKVDKGIMMYRLT